MKIIQTAIEDLVILEPEVYGDQRGYFLESYKEDWWNIHFPDIHFIQDNESKSARGILRGLHFQNPPFDQTKLVRVIYGEVLDVAVDLRTTSASFGKHVSIILSASNKKQLLIPKGFAHGFVVLSDFAIFSYKVDNRYSPEHEGGILWEDKTLQIDWRLSSKEISLSEKDGLLQGFNKLNSPF